MKICIQLNEHHAEFWEIINRNLNDKQQQHIFIWCAIVLAKWGLKWTDEHDERWIATKKNKTKKWADSLSVANTDLSICS